MTFLVNNCPCAQRVRIPFREDPGNPGRPANDTNVVCQFCDRVLRVEGNNRPQRTSFDDEVPPNERGQIRAAQARAAAVRRKAIRPPPGPRPRRGGPPGGGPPGRP